MHIALVDSTSGALTAIESAKQLIDGYDLELWQRDRRISRFDSKPE